MIASTPRAASQRASATVVADDARTGSDDEVDLDRWITLARRVLAAEDARGELTLTFVDDDEMASLNTEHMGKPEPTDVLSFPLDDVDAVYDGVPRLLGDVVIAPGVAATQAAGHAGTYADELALLVVHGILHVLGHDHAEPEETAAMRARELALLEAHHWHGPAPSGFRQDHD